MSELLIHYTVGGWWLSKTLALWFMIHITELLDPASQPFGCSLEMEAERLEWA